MPKLQLPLKDLNLLRYPAGNVFQYFGENCNLYSKLLNSPSVCHNGIDAYTFEGDDVLAAHDGFVLKADHKTTSGNGVWLQGKDCVTCYFHLKEIFVETGDIIKTGEVIGTEGNSGFIISGGTPYWDNAPAGKGVHLHFGVYPIDEYGKKIYLDNGQNGAVDPIPWLKNEEEAEAISAIDKAKKLIAQVLAYLKGR